MSAGAGDSDIEKLARALWGEPNRQQSTREDIRYGSHGSKSVRPKDRTWYDHETNEGGGYNDLYAKVHGARPNGNGNGAAVDVTYDYLTSDGKLLFQVVRMPGKKFRQRKPDADGKWLWKLGKFPRVPYRLPELLHAPTDHPVFVCEGEKDVDNLRAHGLIATTNAGGAGNWQREISAYLRGRDVIILPDNDTPGADHALDVAGKLHGIARSITIHPLPGLPEKGDVSDWMKSGGNPLDLLQIIIIPEPPPPAPVEIGEPPTDDPEYIKSILAEESQSPADAVMSAFNRRYMVVNEAGRAVIFAPSFDAVLKRERFDRMMFDDLKRLYMNRRVRVGDDEKGKPIVRPAAEIWLTSPDRRQYIGGVTFDPASRCRDPDVLNLWKGFTTKPAPGDWSLMRAHILDVLCNRDRERFEYLISWLARMLQKPDTQGEVAVVLKGGEGTGKGTFAKALLTIIGHHALAISNSKHLTGNFNAHLRDVVFLFADEAFFAGDKAGIGSLKSLITEPYLTVEAKYQNAVQIPNFLHILMASNEEWVVPASLDARRFFVLEVPDSRRGNHTYFAAIIAQLQDGGYEAMLHDLLNHDLAGFNVRDVPITEGLQHQKKLSLGTTDSWWMEVLARGYVYQSKCGQNEYFEEWHDEITMEVLYASYTQFATSRHERHPISRETLGREMRRFGCRPKRGYNAVTGEKLSTLIRQPQPPGYRLGTLGYARDGFANATHLQVVWEHEDAD